MDYARAPMTGARTLLVANRGEIAVRIFATARRLGLRTAAVAGPGDEGALHTRVAEVSVPVASYLDPDALVAAAVEAGVDLVHPGYGFLAESAAFAEAVLGAGLTWVGPPPAALRGGGDKLEAKRIAAAAGGGSARSRPSRRRTRPRPRGSPPRAPRRAPPCARRRACRVRRRPRPP